MRAASLSSSAIEGSLSPRRFCNLWISALVLLDVRTDGERKRGSIKGSFHIPLATLHSSQNELKKFKGAEIICYCRTGNRSLNAAAKLNKLGFNAANLRGGIVRWNAAGLK